MTDPERSFVTASDTEIAKVFKSELERVFGAIVFCEEAFWYYNINIWAELNDNDIRLRLHDYDGRPYGKNSIIKLNKSRLDGVFGELKVLCKQEHYFDNKYCGINCRSGFIVFDSEHQPKLIKHDKEHKQRFIINADWPLEQAPSCDLFQNLLEGCFGEDHDKWQKFNMLEELMGVICLSHATKLKSPKAIILKGERAENGKSQVLKLLRGLIPAEARATVSPKHFDTDHYKIQLCGKALNACDELSAEAIASDTFKQVITGDEMTGCEKYKQPVSFCPEALNVFATNVLPSFKSGMDRGVIRRLMVLTFNRSIPENEKIEDIAEKILACEMDYLLESAVLGASRVLKKGKYTEPESSRPALQEWIYNADPVQAWVDLCTDVCPNFKIEKKRVYAFFKEWAISEGYETFRLPAPNNFTQRLKSCMPHYGDTRTGQARFYVGFRVINA